MIKVKVQGESKKLSALLAKLKDTGPALQEIGQKAVESTQRRIRDTKISPDGSQFAPWSYATALARQKDGTSNRGILFKTGNLLNSITFQVTGNQVTIGADQSAPYARFLQEGTMKMPARPFVGFSTEDLNMIRQVLRTHLRT